MDLSLFPVLSLMMVMSLVKFFIESTKRQDQVSLIIKKLDSDEARERLVQMAIGESFPQSIGMGHLLVPSIILTLIGTIPDWVIWTYWLLLILNIIASLHQIFSPSYLSRNEMPKGSIFIGFFGMLTIPFIICLYVYTVYAAWVLI